MSYHNLDPGLNLSTDVQVVHFQLREGDIRLISSANGMFLKLGKICLTIMKKMMMVSLMLL